MLASISVSAGDRVTAIGGIGGGYGDPLRRPPELVREDVADGYITREAAAEMFGVTLKSDGSGDTTGTTDLRASRQQ